LTRQLLMFSRRQVIQSRNLDLNESIDGLMRMLQRLIGVTIHTEVKLHPEPLTVFADAGMLDQVLMNLSVNARDAMPEGGTLLIETSRKIVDEEMARLHADAVPGEYAWLSVSDTGTGIPPEVLPHIFEPFFTTKEAGKGTGLGLATVFGIVKQHKGWMKVYSELGRGTSFQIFLPLVAGPSVELAARATPLLRGGPETILLAEDEDAVRILAQGVLERFGYEVLVATDGVEALRLWHQHRARVSLLLTDLVMPGGLNGKQLARLLRDEKPELKIVYVSGYSAEIAGRELELHLGENFLQKPFPLDQLVDAVRRMLDGLPTNGRTG